MGYNPLYGTRKTEVIERFIDPKVKALLEFLDKYTKGQSANLTAPYLKGSFHQDVFVDNQDKLVLKVTGRQDKIFEGQELEKFLSENLELVYRALAWFVATEIHQKWIKAEEQQELHGTKQKDISMFDAKNALLVLRAQANDSLTIEGSAAFLEIMLVKNL